MLIGNFAFASDDVKNDTKKVSTFDVEKALTNSLELTQCTFVTGNNLNLPLFVDTEEDRVIEVGGVTVKITITVKGTSCMELDSVALS